MSYLEDCLVYLETESWRFVWAGVSIFVIFFVYRFITKIIDNSADDLELEPHIKNALRLLLRVITIIIALTVLFSIFELPTDVFIGGSALLGAAIGFGSSQTINNIVAGFYVLISQPFKVKDYIKIGDLEGQVEEISINYTNLYTPTFNLLKVPNTQVMNSRILNLTHEGYIKYTFTISFSHELTEEQIIDTVINPAIQDFLALKGNYNLRCPEVYLDTANRLEKTYLIRLFIPKGEAKTLFIMQPELNQLIMKYFDSVKN